MELRDAPPGFQIERRELEALRDNHMGRVITYRDGSRTIKLYSGPDLYDRLEDLDMTAEAVRTSDHDFTLSSTLLAPELLIATLESEKLEEPCDDIGVLTKHVSKETMLQILEAVRIIEE